MHALLIWSLVLASPVPPAGPPEPVRVYTHADLDRLGSPPGRGGPAVERQPEEALGWGFVADVLDREQRRREAEREADLERRRLEVEAAAAPPAQPLPVSPWSCRERGRDRRAGPQDPAQAVDPRIRPLHAGPTSAMQHRAKAIKTAATEPR